MRKDNVGLLLYGNVGSGKTYIACSIANAVLKERDIYLTPDILINAGGVTVSYFEWAQNIQGYYWSEEEVFEKQEASMKRAFDKIWDLVVEKDVTIREAAYLISVKKIHDAMKLRGWI